MVGSYVLGLRAIEIWDRRITLYLGFGVGTKHKTRSILESCVNMVCVTMCSRIVNTKMIG